jgi:thiol:disulfide interchange protein DsbA
MLKKLITLFLLLPTLALSASFVEGKDYQILTHPQAKSNKTPIIQEFFSYGCPWCYKIESSLNDWVSKMGKNLEFERVPVVFKPSWELYAKAYYTVKTLALADKMDSLLFKTIQDEGNPLDTRQAMINFFIAQGVDKEIAQSAFEHSSTIDMRVQNAINLMASYQINAVPAFVVNNKYKTDLQMAGSQERLLELLNYLSRR